MQPNSLPELLTVTQASQILYCHPNTLRQWERQGLIKSVRLGLRKDRKFPREEIMRLLQTEQKTAGATSAYLPSDYDLSRIDMTGTVYEEVSEHSIA